MRIIFFNFPDTDWLDMVYQFVHNFIYASTSKINWTGEVLNDTIKADYLLNDSLYTKGRPNYQLSGKGKYIWLDGCK